MINQPSAFFSIISAFRGAAQELLAVADDESELKASRIVADPASPKPGH
jgi:hypothetical protein